MPDSANHIVVTIHGIRTFGNWQERLETVVRASNPNIKFFHYKFGYFSLFAFLTPILRWISVKRFQKELCNIVSIEAPDRLDIVAHSFGTHLIAWCLRNLPSNSGVRVHTVILAGSVLRSSFYWPSLIPSRISRLVNDCGVFDSILLLSQFFVLFTGMAGRTGFVGMDGPNFANRFSTFGHSGYFYDAKLRTLTDAYMIEHWAPLLVGEAPIQGFDERDAPSAMRGAAIWFTNNMEPLKLTLYAAPILGLALYFGGLSIERKMTTDRVTALLELSEAANYIREEGDPEILLGTFRAALKLPFQRTYALWLDSHVGNNPFERQALHRFGICFDSAENGIDALKLIEKHPNRYSMIISNFLRESDSLTGYGVLRQLKDRGVSIPYIFYVNNFTDEQAADARREGAIDEVRGAYALVNRVVTFLDASHARENRLNSAIDAFRPCRVLHSISGDERPK